MAKLKIIAKLFIKPNEYWEYISMWELNVKQLTFQILLPFALLSAAGEFIGKRFFGIIYELNASAIYATSELFSYFIAIFLTASAVSKMSANYGQKRDYKTVLKLVVFSALPVYIGLFLSHLHFTLEIFKLLGLYCAYIFWFGSIELLQTKEEKRVGFGVIYGLILLCSFYVSKFVLLWVLKSAVEMF